MLKIRFNSDFDEVKFFVQLKEIEMFSDTKIKCAMLVKEEDPSHRASDLDPSQRASDLDVKEHPGCQDKLDGPPDPDQYIE